MLDIINQSIQNSLATTNLLLTNEKIKNDILLVANKSVEVFNKKGKLLFCGNGGSAADAQHIASELSGKFSKDRPALSAEALHVNSSFMTAVANDYGYDHTYSRMVEAIAHEGDVLVAISTSGNSTNVVNALQKAKEKKLYTVGLTGLNGGKMNEFCDVIINVPSNETARIQESHILIGHIICQIIEEKMF